MVGVLITLICMYQFCSENASDPSRSGPIPMPIELRDTILPEPLPLTAHCALLILQSKGHVCLTQSRGPCLPPDIPQEFLTNNTLFPQPKKSLGFLNSHLLHYLPERHCLTPSYS